MWSDLLRLLRHDRGGEQLDGRESLGDDFFIADHHPIRVLQETGQLKKVCRVEDAGQFRRSIGQQIFLTSVPVELRHNELGQLLAYRGDPCAIVLGHLNFPQIECLRTLPTAGTGYSQ